MARIEQDIREEEQRQRAEAKAKREQIDRAEKNKLAPVDDSQMVDEMFGFIDAQTDSSGEGAAPTAFKVNNELHSPSFFKFLGMSVSYQTFTTY